MKILIDMNLSPEWVEVLRQAGHQALHWSQLGPAKAPDKDLLEWAKRHGHLVFSNDLDFSRLLALTYARGPSVLQIRGSKLLPEDAIEIVLAVLGLYAEPLRKGALVVLDEKTARIRLLPIR